MQEIVGGQVRHRDLVVTFFPGVSCKRFAKIYARENFPLEGIRYHLTHSCITSREFYALIKRMREQA